MRSLLTLFLIGLLAACQTVPVKPGFNRRQVAVLKEVGFSAVEDRWELGMPDRTLFPVDESALKPEQIARLGELSHRLVGVGIFGARVDGHTDSTGTTAYNMDLSLRRAESVKGALSSGGMNAAAIRAEGLGETRPIAGNDTEDGRSQNRRVVIIVAPADTVPR